MHKVREKVPTGRIGHASTLCGMCKGALHHLCGQPSKEMLEFGEVVGLLNSEPSTPGGVCVHRGFHTARDGFRTLAVVVSQPEFLKS